VDPARPHRRDITAQLFSRTAQKSDASTTVDVRSEESYELDHIMDHPRNEQGEMTYKVRWKGYEPSDDMYSTVHPLPQIQFQRHCQ
jgi:hypothetical protein